MLSPKLFLLAAVFASSATEPSCGPTVPPGTEMVDPADPKNGSSIAGLDCTKFGGTPWNCSTSGLWACECNVTCGVCGQVVTETVWAQSPDQAFSCWSSVHLADKDITSVGCAACSKHAADRYPACN